MKPPPTCWCFSASLLTLGDSTGPLKRGQNRNNVQERGQEFRGNRDTDAAEEKASDRAAQQSDR